MLVRLALRNLTRNTRRTLITLVSIAFGLFLSILITGMGESGYRTMVESAARMSAGHLAALPTGFLDAPSLNKTIERCGEMTVFFKSFPDVEHVVTRITGQAMVATAADSTGAAFMAIDPAFESCDTLYFYNFIREGTFFKDSASNGIVMGSIMAERLKAQTGSKIVYTTTDKNGEITSGLARITGIFETGIIEVDGYFVLLPLDTTRQSLAYGPQEATMTAAFLNDYEKAESIFKNITSGIYPETSRFSGEWATWKQTSSEISGWVTIDRSMNKLFQIIIFLLISAGILNTVLMSVLERTREFGILLSVGMTPVAVFFLICTEAVWLGIIGIALGSFITWPVYHYIAEYGLDFTALLTEKTSISGVLFDPVIYVYMRFETLMVIFGTVLFLTVVSSLYPAWRASRVHPVEAVKTY